MIVPLDENGFRNAKPDFAGRQNTAHLGRTDAEHVGAERAAGWRMAVTPTQNMPGDRCPRSGSTTWQIPCWS